MGRPCKGPNLVDGLDGSAEARTRLRIVLETIAGQRTVAEACADGSMSREEYLGWVRAHRMSLPARFPAAGPE